MGNIRPAAIAGQFYEADKGALSQSMQGFLALDGDRTLDDDKEKAAAPFPKALIVPHAGHIYSGQLAGQAYQLWKPARGIIKKIIMLGPCHRQAVRGMAISSASHWRTPLGDVQLDQEIMQKARALDFIEVNDTAHEKEHCLEVHLPFLQSLFGDQFTLAPFGVGGCEVRDIAALLQKFWGGAETAIVISTDLSHFHSYQQALAIDDKTCKAVESFAWNEISRDMACGRGPLSGLLSLGRQQDLALKRIGAINSGDTAGDKKRVVGYGAWAVWENAHQQKASLPDNVICASDGPAPSKDQELIKNHGQQLLQIAHQVLHYAVTTHKMPQIKGQLPPELMEKRAVFVTLERGGRLRGCIGSLEATRPLLEDICHNTVGAALRDPRFPAVSPQELPEIHLSLSLLTAPQAMSFKDEADFMAQIRPHQDGLIITDQGKRATYLPSVWEQIPDKQTFIKSLKAKAGLAENHWSPQFQAWRYGALKLG